MSQKYDLNSEALIEVLDELPLWSAPFGWALLDKIHYQKNIAALDIGFGTGFPLTELAMRLGETCEVYGIDPWEAAIHRVEKKLKCYGIENVMILHGSAEKIPLPNNAIDLITSNNGMNNVSNLAKVLGECSRIMKPGSQFVQTMNLEDTMIEFYEIFKKTLKHMLLLIVKNSNATIQ